MRLPARIFLIGFSASGKSTVAPLLAKRLDYKPVDTDAEIEQRQGLPCDTIIHQRGLDFFRECESRLLRELCATGSQGIVAALGGGAITIPGIPELLRNAGATVWLQVSAETVISRLPELLNRPLLAGKTPTEIQGFLELRNSRYAQAADFQVRVDGRTPDEIAREIERLWQWNTPDDTSPPKPQTP